MNVRDCFNRRTTMQANVKYRKPSKSEEEDEVESDIDEEETKVAPSKTLSI
jgi:hypothetical protein